MPTTRVVIGSKKFSLGTFRFFLASNSVTTALCSALASLTSLNFLYLGDELKPKTVGIVFDLRIHLDGPNPSRIDKT